MNGAAIATRTQPVLLQPGAIFYACLTVDGADCGGVPVVVKPDGACAPLDGFYGLYEALPDEMTDEGSGACGDIECHVYRALSAGEHWGLATVQGHAVAWHIGDEEG